MYSVYRAFDEKAVDKKREGKTVIPEWASGVPVTGYPGSWCLEQKARQDT